MLKATFSEGPVRTEIELGEYNINRLFTRYKKSQNVHFDQNIF